MKPDDVTWCDLLGAVARGWCSEENKHKKVDVVLAEAIAKEVEKLITSV